MERQCVLPMSRWKWLDGLLTLFFIMPFLFITQTADGGEVVDRIVAVVNDDIILQSELNEKLLPIVMQIQSSGYTNQRKKEMMYRYREDILNKMIEEKLTQQEIENKKILVTEKEVDSAIERIKQANLFTDEELKKKIAQQGSDMASYRLRLKEQILQSKLINLEIKSKIVITSSDIQSYYENNKDEFEGEKKYHLRNLMIPVSSSADEKDRLDAKKRLESILVRIKSGQPFDKTDTIGKDIGFIGEKKLSPQLQSALKNLKPGEYSAVLDTDQGFQVFYVQDIQVDAGKSLAESSADIERTLYNDVMKNRFRTWIDELKKNSHIKIIR